MIPKGCCCNCIQIYHLFPCSKRHQKTQGLEWYSVPKRIFPVSTRRFQGRHRGVPESCCREASPQLRDELPRRGWGPHGIPRAERAGQSHTKHMVSYSIPAPRPTSKPSCPWAAARCKFGGQGTLCGHATQSIPCHLSSSVIRTDICLHQTEQI